MPALAGALKYARRTLEDESTVGGRSTWQASRATAAQAMSIRIPWRRSAAASLHNRKTDGCLTPKLSCVRHLNWQDGDRTRAERDGRLLLLPLCSRPSVAATR